MSATRAAAVGACLWCVLLASSGCAAKRVETPSADSGTMSRKQVVQVLIHHGYRDITGLYRNGEDWIGAATKHGQVLNFDVDKTGNVNPIPAQPH